MVVVLEALPPPLLYTVREVLDAKTAAAAPHTPLLYPVVVLAEPEVPESLSLNTRTGSPAKSPRIANEYLPVAAPMLHRLIRICADVMLVELNQQWNVSGFCSPPRLLAIRRYCELALAKDRATDQVSFSSTAYSSRSPVAVSFATSRVTLSRNSSPTATLSMLAPSLTATLVILTCPLVAGTVAAVTV